MNHRATHGLRAIVVGIALAGTTACAHRGGSSARPPAYVYFTNDSQDQADVYAVVSGRQPVRLGTVFSNRTETLVVPGDVAARGTDVSVIARLLARKITPSSGPLTIQPGDKLSIRLPADLRQLVVLPGQR